MLHALLISSIHWTVLPSTQSWSTRVCTWADLRPTQKVASTRIATKRTFPAWRCRKQPSWNKWPWRRALSQSAARSPVALPWNNMATTVTLLPLKRNVLLSTPKQEDGSRLLRNAWNWYPFSAALQSSCSRVPLSSCAVTKLFSVFDLPILSALHNRKWQCVKKKKKMDVHRTLLEHIRV